MKRRRPAVPVVARGRLEVVSATFHSALNRMISCGSTIHIIASSRKLVDMYEPASPLAIQGYGKHPWCPGVEACAENAAGIDARGG